MANAKIVLKTTGTIPFGNDSLDRLSELVVELKAQRILVITEKRCCNLVNFIKK